MAASQDSPKKKKEDRKKLTEGMHWYVIQVYAGFENHVAKQLTERIQLMPGLKERFGQILIPTEEVVEMRKGQKRKSERKFFPGYILMEIDLNEEVWHLVKSIPKVVNFIGGKSDSPAPISQKQADAILNRMKSGESKPKPKVLYEPGEVIRVIEGPFADFNGVVEDVNYEKSRLKVSVLIFGRSTPVELEFGQVEKA